MVNSIQAAFRIFEIVAILFPLLLIAIQLFSRELRTDERTVIAEFGEFIRFFYFGAFALTGAIVFASLELARLTTSILIEGALVLLYIGFLLIGITTGMVGRQIYRAIEDEPEQVVLTESAPEEDSREPEVEHEHS